MLRSYQRISPGPRCFETFRNNKNFYSEGLIAPCPTPKLESHPSSAVRDCLFNIFPATLRTWSSSLRPQSEDALCVVTMDPPKMGHVRNRHWKWYFGILSAMISKQIYIVQYMSMTVQFFYIFGVVSVALAYIYIHIYIFIIIYSLLHV
jgi:hypothetical protein